MFVNLVLKDRYYLKKKKKLPLLMKTITNLCYSCFQELKITCYLKK